MQREKNPHKKKNNKRKLKSELLTDTPVKKFAAVNEKHQKKNHAKQQKEKENQAQKGKPAQKEKPQQKKNLIQKEKLKQKGNPKQKEKLAQRKGGSKRESKTFLRWSLNQKHVSV